MILMREFLGVVAAGTAVCGLFLGLAQTAPLIMLSLVVIAWWGLA